MLLRSIQMVFLNYKQNVRIRRITSSNTAVLDTVSYEIQFTPFLAFSSYCIQMHTFSRDEQITFKRLTMAVLLFY